MTAAPAMPAVLDRSPGAPPAAASVLIVIVNFRTPTLTNQCLASLEPEAAAVPGVQVVVVDNDSGDGSAEAIAEEIERRGWGDWAVLLRTGRNGGFAYGNNRGIEAGLGRWDPRYILLLNSDTVVHPGCVKRCIEVMDAEPRIGAMSCCLLNADGTVQNVARRFPSPARLIATAMGLPWRLPRLFGHLDCEDSGWDRRTEARDVDWLGGAFLFCRADVIRRLGGLDERFFFYGEDIEFCHRLRRAGHRIRFDPGATTVHLGGQSSDPTRMAARLRNANIWRARYTVQRMCYGRAAAGLVRVMDVVTLAFRCAALWLGGRRGRARLRDTIGALRTLLYELGEA
jgi:N-acetylglucosaminyl-diphospho-decaprenol L-rhamnosyltransferase